MQLYITPTSPYARITRIVVLEKRLEEFKSLSEMLFFRRKLNENEGNIKRTAERLGMQRSHLYKKLDRYDLRS